LKFCHEYDLIRNFFISSLSAEKSMRILCGRWSDLFGGKEWILAKGINFHSDIENIKEWIAVIISEEGIPSDTEALYFSVSHPETANTFDLRMTGSSCFVADTDGFFEDILLSDSFIPKKCFAHSQALEDLFHITNGNIDSPAGQLLPLAFAALASSSACMELSSFPLQSDIMLAASHISRFPLMIKRLK